MKLRMYWQHFNYVMEHKKNVFKVCWKKKMYLHAFMHDLSKLSPKEFFPYAEWFYGEFGTRLEKEYTKEQLTNGMSCLSRNYLECKKNFDKAWKHHYYKNPHHWDFWVYSDTPLAIPMKFLEQIIADWKAMSLKFGGSAQQYYLEHYFKIRLEYVTRIILELMLGINDSLANNYAHTLEEFANMYSEEEYYRYFDKLITEVYKVKSYPLLRKG